MDSYFQQKILTGASERGMVINLPTLKKHHLQGYMNEVFTATSSVGEIIIHVIKLKPSQRHVLVAKKIKALSDELHSITGIPIPKVHLTFDVDPYIIFVSQFLPGFLAGTRIQHDSDFTNKWHIALKDINNNIEKTIAEIHSFQPEKFGWVGKSSIKHGGGYETWIGFLLHEIKFWSEKISDAESMLDKQNDNLAKRLLTYLDSVKTKLEYYTAKPVLVHGDITNPSNILIVNNRVTGVIDWEFAIAADPAWEFAYKNDYQLETYFFIMKEKNIDIEEHSFSERVNTYTPLVCGLWAFIHSFEPTGKLYSVCRGQLLSALVDYGF